MLLEEALARQRNEMMDNFAEILRRLSTGTEGTSSNNQFGGPTPFKVQVNFDIPLFEGQIDAYALEKWLNQLEGYLSVHNFSNREKITFALLKAVPHVKDWWETLCEQKEEKEGHNPYGHPSLMPSRSNTSLWGTMTTSTQNGQLCDKKGTKQ
jgi:hypothetical protein